VLKTGLTWLFAMCSIQVTTVPTECFINYNQVPTALLCMPPNNNTC